LNRRKIKTNPKNQLAPKKEAKVPEVKVPELPPAISHLLDFRAEDGIVARWKTSQLNRKAVLETLDVRYKGHLELLKHSILKEMEVGKTSISVRAEEMLRQLDAKHLEIMAQLDMQNVETRMRMMQDATDLVVAEIRKVENSDWPKTLKEEVIVQALALHKGYFERVMAEKIGNEQPF
jgi:hypothetical protein